jgi:hypothetical protein
MTDEMGEGAAEVTEKVLTADVAKAAGDETAEEMLERVIETKGIELRLRMALAMAAWEVDGMGVIDRLVSRVAQAYVEWMGDTGAEMGAVAESRAIQTVHASYPVGGMHDTDERRAIFAERVAAELEKRPVVDAAEATDTAESGA